MSSRLIGTIQKMNLVHELENHYQLSNDIGEALLPKADFLEEVQIDTLLDVFIYSDKRGKLIASPQLPTAVIGMYGWGEIVEVLPNLGAFINLGTTIDILISMDDLPTFDAAWPAVGDKLYVRLKKDKKDRLLAVPATENEFKDVYTFAEAEQVELNDKIQGFVIRPGKEGAVIITDDKYRGFVHHTEREKELRLGERVSGRVIEVKEDGSLNLSLLPLKHERIDDDADIILNYLKEQDGNMPYGNKTDAEAIRETFQMSKSAFKRALGRLFKEGKVEPKDHSTSLL